MTTQPWYSDPVSWATIVIALATLFYTWYSRRMWQSMKQGFQVGYTPIVGVKTISWRAEDLQTLSPIEITITNLGTWPASELDISVRPSINGAVQIVPITVEKRLCLIPGHTLMLTAEVPNEAGQAIWQGKQIIQIEIELSYRGLMDQKCSSRYKYEFDSRKHSFFLRGSSVDLGIGK